VGGLFSHKGINIPGRTLAISAFTVKDREDTTFALEQELDWLALSFVRTPDDLRTVREWMSKPDDAIPLIAKIEKREAIQSLDAVLAESNGAMVARGDLGVEVALEEVPFLQKDIVAGALSLSVPVIVATHMLESMITQPRPTRAEVTDVAPRCWMGRCDHAVEKRRPASIRWSVRIMAHRRARGTRLDHVDS
jgi:pyruvate kinase